MKLYAHVYKCMYMCKKIHIYVCTYTYMERHLSASVCVDRVRARKLSPAIDLKSDVVYWPALRLPLENLHVLLRLGEYPFQTFRQSFVRWRPQKEVSLSACLEASLASGLLTSVDLRAGIRVESESQAYVSFLKHQPKQLEQQLTLTIRLLKPNEVCIVIVFS